MTDGAFHAYQTLLVVSALALLVLAGRGFGQRPFSRILDGLLGLAFGGYAAYLFVIKPEQVLILWYAFAAPAIAVVYGLRSRRRERRRRRLFAGLARALSSSQPAPKQTPLTPFPPPPPPLGSQPPAAPAEPAERPSYQPMPSGLPSAPPVGAPLEQEPGRKGMPSGLPRGAAAPVADSHMPAPGRLHGVEEDPHRRPPRAPVEDKPGRRKLHGTEQWAEPAPERDEHEVDKPGPWGKNRPRQPGYDPATGKHRAPTEQGTD